VWQDETTKEKKESIERLRQENEEREPLANADWEIEQAMRRLWITRQYPRKSQFGSGKTGQLERNSKGGIDWHRYNKEILEKKLLPFAKECVKDRPNTIVQEDNASPHAHHYNRQVFNIWEIKRML
jgi:hypothetical protein